MHVCIFKSEKNKSPKPIVTNTQRLAQKSKETCIEWSNKNRMSDMEISFYTNPPSATPAVCDMLTSKLQRCPNPVPQT